MRFFAIIALFAGANFAHASQIGCETMVSIAVAQMLHAGSTDEMVHDVTLVPTDSFAELNVYRVNSGRSSAGPGIPYSSVWLVVTRTGPQATCTIEQVIADRRAQ